MSTPRRSTWLRWAGLTIERGSRVEATRQGRWTTDLAPVAGPVLGPFARRSEALAAERQWVEDHWLLPAPAE